MPPSVIGTSKIAEVDTTLAKVLLIIPPMETIYGAPGIPRLGLAYLSGSLKRDGLEHRILDLNLYPKWKEELGERIQGYSIFGITATTFEFDSAKRVAQHIKKQLPDSKIVLGGAHATVADRRTLESFKDIDYYIRGEGERSFPRLVQLLTNGDEQEIEKMDNLCYRKDGYIKRNSIVPIQEIDDIPLPNYDNFELAKYRAFPQGIFILTSRGCPFKCIFCSVGTTMGRRFRARAPENVLNEMEGLIKKYGVSEFSINDDNFTLHIDRAKEICRGIISREFHIRWKLANGIRADKLDRELLALMKKSGCTQIALGIESCNNEILRALRKGETLQDMEKAISLIQEQGINIKGFFLIGSPGETKNDVKDYIKFAIDKRLDIARFGMLTPYPGTELWDWIEKNNYWIVNDPLAVITTYTDIGKVKALYETPSFSKKDKELVYDEVWRTWENYVSKRRGMKDRIARRLAGYPLLYFCARILHRIARRFIGQG